MRRGLPQDALLPGRSRSVTLEDTFRFECQRCGGCCFRCEIVLTPYDLLRLCEHLKLSTFDFIKRYGAVSVGPNSGLPVLSLDFEKAQRERGGRPEDPSCPFLTFDGRMYACGVYPAKPGCCRSYPLFRVAGEDGIQLMLQEVTCPAAETDKEWTVAQWIEHEGLEEYHLANRLFMSQVVRLTRKSGGRPWPLWFVSGLALLWYGFSRLEGETLREKYERSMELAEKAVQLTKMWPANHETE